MSPAKCIRLGPIVKETFGARRAEPPRLSWLRAWCLPPSRPGDGPQRSARCVVVPIDIPTNLRYTVTEQYLSQPERLDGRLKARKARLVHGSPAVKVWRAPSR